MPRTPTKLKHSETTGDSRFGNDRLSKKGLVKKWQKKTGNYITQGFQRVPYCLEVFKYLRVSKKNSFVTPGLHIISSLVKLNTSIDSSFAKPCKTNLVPQFKTSRIYHGTTGRTTTTVCKKPNILQRDNQIGEPFTRAE